MRNAKTPAITGTKAGSPAPPLQAQTHYVAIRPIGFYTILSNPNLLTPLIFGMPTELAKAAGGNICGTDLLTGTKLVDIINISSYDGCGTPISFPSMNDRAGGQFDASELAQIQAWINGGAPELCTDFCVDLLREETVAICTGEDYVFPDGMVENNVTADLVYTSNLISLAGCDSIVTTNLEVQSIFANAVQVALCSGDAYTFPDGSIQNNITLPTTQTSNLQTSAGCDSLITTNILVNESYNNIETIEVCAGDDYIFPDGSTQNNITLPTTQTSNLQTIGGCDSLVTTNILVNENYNNTQTIEVCAGDGYTFPDGTSWTDINSDASYVSNLQTFAGCDSTIQSNVIVLPTYNLTENVSICSGNSYTFPDGTTENNITTNLNYTSDLNSSQGCDSVIVTSVSVDPQVLISEAVNLCEGGSYTFPDGNTQNNITNDQTYVSTLLGNNTCDTIITTNLMIQQTSTLFEIQEICAGESYVFPDGTTLTNVTDDQIYSSLLVSFYGCDSTVTTNLVVNSTPSATLVNSICEGESYSFPDGTVQNNITTDVQQTSVLTTVDGCDSLLTTILEVQSTYLANESAQICAGESYMFPDGTIQNNINTPVSYSSTLQSINGCDSTIVTALTVNPTFSASEQIEICAGGTYTFPDGNTQTDINMDMSYTSNLQSISGCDSIIQSEVIVFLNYNQTVSVSLCSGSNYIFPDGTVENNITSNLSYTSDLSSSQGCDSVIVTSVSVDPQVLILEAVNLCEGSSYTFPDGSTQNNIISDLSYVSTLLGNNSCDTLLTTNLMVQQASTVTEVQQVCEGESYIFPDGMTMTNITTNQSYSSLLLSSFGCDSTVITNLEVNSVYSVMVGNTVCEGASFTFPDGSIQNNITTAIQQASMLTAMNGCDSLVTTDLVVVDAYTINENFQICEGESYTFPDGSMMTNITSDQVYSSQLISTQGCDSLIVTELIVNSTYSIMASAQICEGGSFTFPDGTVQNNISTNVQQSSMLTAMNGCDSLVTTDLVILDTYTINESFQICEGESFTFPDGSIMTDITSDQVYSSQLTSAQGCDSLIVTELAVNSIYSIMVDAQICDGGTFTFPDGTVQNNITTNVQQASMLTAMNGCDSLVTTDLVVVDAYTINESFQICDGESYTFPDGSTEDNISEDLIYESNLMSVDGCDSIVTTGLTVEAVYEISEENAICQGEEYTFPDGMTQTNIQGDIIYTSMLTSFDGCDSIVTTELLVTVIDTTVSAQGSTLTANAAAATYQWLDCGNNFEVISGANSQTFSPSENGTYAVAVTQDGCVDTSSCRTILLVGISKIEEVLYGLRPNPVREVLYITGEIHQAPEVTIYNALGQLCLVPFDVDNLSLDVDDLASGVYFLKLRVGEAVYVMEFVKQW